MSLEQQPSFEQLLEKAKIPNFDFPETVIRVLASMFKYFEWINRPQVKVTKFKVNKRQVSKMLDTIKKEKRIHLSEPETYRILRAYGMKAVDYRFAKDLDKVIVAANQIGYPVVLKIVSPDILHKIDVGGVKS